MKTLPGNRNEWKVATCIIMDRSQRHDQSLTQDDCVLYDFVSMTLWKRQNHRDRKQTNGYLVGVEGGDWIQKRKKELLGGDDNVLQIKEKTDGSLVMAGKGTKLIAGKFILSRGYSSVILRHRAICPGFGLGKWPKFHFYVL